MTPSTTRLLCLLAVLAGCDASDVARRTDPCPVGSLDCPCAAAPACEDDLVCDATAHVCRMPVICEELTCAPHRLCAPPADGQDAFCDEACEPGWAWSARAGICSPLPPTCEPTAVTSVLATCEAASRECLELGGRGRCGRCLEGFVEDPAAPGGPCAPAPICTDDVVAQCAATGRACVDGACADCLPDHVEDGDVCVPTNCGGEGVPGGLGDACAALMRTCVATAEDGISAAQCGDCLDGHLPDDGSEACRRVETCASLTCPAVSRLCVPGGPSVDARCGDCRADHEEIGGRCVPRAGYFCEGDADLSPACAAEGRTCDPAGPLGARCGGCVEGFVEHPETGACVEPMDCATLDCAASGRACEPSPTAVCTTCLPTHVEDAAGFCRAPLTCGDLACGRLECEEAPAGVVADARCVTPCRDDQLWNGRECAPCPPCDGPGVVGREPRPTRAGWCICETEPGYFYSIANEVGAVICDGDGDGWVRESARQIIDSGDPVLVANARCTLREIDRIVLHDGADAASVRYLDAPLPLYESVRNDDERTLRGDWARAGLPTSPWGPDGVGVSTALINPFTKLCHGPRADYNDNGLADAYEFGSAPLAPGFRPDQQPFNTFSYFVELYRGWFEPLEGETTQGAWHIAERRRAPDEAGEVPMRAAGDGTWWRECVRRPDPQGELDPPVGLDFAAEGLLHHSQFKCVVVRDVPDEAQPLEMTPAEAAARYDLNGCVATDAPAATAGNPAEPRLTCGLLDADPAPGSAVWGTVPYTAYQANPGHVGYAGGCVNTCAEAMMRHAARADDLLCPGLPENIPACVGEVADSGRLTCLEVPCDQIDNDGDGETDEGRPVTCATGLLGVCGTGAPRCEGVRLVCDPPTPTDEICDGLDNDCDGVVDEDTSGVPCAAASPTTGLPARPGLPGVCGVRVTQCIAGVLDCLPVAAYEPVGETTCDGLDNDCDGLVDEQLVGVQVPGQPGGVGFGDACQDPEARFQGACAQTAWQCVAGAAGCLPSVEPADEGCPPGAPAGCRRICDGIDNDCDGETDEDGACLRNWTGGFSLNPLLRAEDANMGGSAVTMNVSVEFGGQGTEAITATLTVEAIEQYHTPTEGYIQRSRSAGTEGMVANVVGGTQFRVEYIDADDDRDILKRPGISAANNPFEPNVQRVTDHPAVVTMICNGRVPGGDDIVRADGNYRADRAGCELQFSVDYTIVPPENPCLGDPEPERCDGLDNDCDGHVDEVERPMPDTLVLVFGPQTTFDRDDRLVARLADGTERVVLANASLEWLDFFFGVIPIGPVHVTVPGATLQLRFEDAGRPGRIQVERLFDGAGAPLPVPDSLRGLSGGQTSDRVDFADSLGLGQTCGAAVGACTEGRRACQDGAVVCSGGVEPVPEADVCDGIDDDCDGVVDDGIREPCDTTCGRGTRSCGANAECKAECPELCGVTGFRTCAEGAEVYGACRYDFPVEVCNGVDDDCDGTVDEGFQVDAPCTVGVGACVAAGVFGCLADGSVGCSAVPSAPVVEACNGVDDDCDGDTDEAIEAPLAAEQRGVCAGTRQICGGARGFEAPDLDLLPGYEAAETSCDGLDNDCDGEVDEADDLGPVPRADRTVGVCVGSVKVCDGGDWVEPDYTAVATFEETEASCRDALDNDCDGRVDAADADCTP